jgi:dCMP deaminase
MNEVWNQRFFDLALHVAGWSKDPSTKVGAVIVNNKKQVLSHGYNGFPRGIEDSEERYADRPTKLQLVCHAERNALDNALFDVEGATLYSTLFPCTECTKGIIQRGISTVVTKDWRTASNRSVNAFAFETSESMLLEAGVKVLLI